MRRFGSRRDATGRSIDSKEETNVPTSCPICRSTSIKTAAKTPDSLSYWRCTSCGEIWNGSRRHAVSGDRGRWP
jgi:transposase-like protein